MPVIWAFSGTVRARLKIKPVAEIADTSRRVADRGRQIQAVYVLLGEKDTGHGFKIEPTAEMRRGQDAARGGEG